MYKYIGTVQYNASGRKLYLLFLWQRVIQKLAICYQN